MVEVIMILNNDQIYVEGTEVPEGYTVIECNDCKKKFMIPSNDVIHDWKYVCKGCFDTANVVTLKTEDSPEKAAIDAALGK